jgi:hypothetical protein
MSRKTMVLEMELALRFLRNLKYFIYTPDRGTCQVWLVARSGLYHSQTGMPIRAIASSGRAAKRRRALAMRLTP